MAGEQQTLPTVREQIDKVKDRLVTEGKIAPDPDAAVQAAGVPTFSEGTATLDPNTGKPVAPATQAKDPTFTEGGVQIPPGTETTGAEPAPASKEAILAAHQTRMAEAEKNGQFPVSQEAGASAAEAAAQALAPATEYDEFEWEDPDFADSETPIKFPIRVPKQYAEIAKRGYGRRAALDRAIRYAKDAEPALRAMIEDGRIKQIMPLLQAALENPQYGEYVTKGFQRLSQGLPLIEQAKIEAAAAGAAAVETPPQTYDFNGDPFLAEQFAPILKTVETLQGRLDRQEQERQTQVLAAQEQQRTNLQIANEIAEAHRDLAGTYPALFSLKLGPKDPHFKRARDYADEAGYIRAYGWRAGIIFGGQQLNNLEQERLAATSSPAADALRQIEAKNTDLARQQAAGAAKAVGGGSATPAPPPPAMARPTSFNPDGSLKPAAQILVENQAWLATQGATA